MSYDIFPWKIACSTSISDRITIKFNDIMSLSCLEQKYLVLLHFERCFSHLSENGTKVSRNLASVKKEYLASVKKEYLFAKFVC